MARSRYYMEQYIWIECRSEHIQFTTYSIIDQVAGYLYIGRERGLKLFS